jgi:hypothetical protein
MVIRRRLGNAAAFVSTGGPNGATGHVMIVGPNADFIGVGKSEKIESVAAKMMGGIYPDPKTRPGGLLVYRRYEH